MPGDAGGDGDQIDQTAQADQTGVSGSSVAAELALVSARRYQLLGELARGGGGRIVRARDLAFDRIVALKEPLDPVNGGDRLRAEAAILASLQHPSIVPIYDHGTRLDGVPFFAMKLVEGRSLREVIRDAPTLAQRLALIPQVVAVAEAVAYAHSQGVIHRDLKPANVLVGAFGETIVIDWGIAKACSTDAITVDGRGDQETARPALAVATTATGAVVGTPAYMAPEQARGERIDARVDVYALGAVLYHVLAGAAPFSSGSGRDVIAAVIAGGPEPIEQLQQRVPADLAAIVTKAMAREPADRYPTAAGFAEDLVRFETGRLVAARRYSLIARARRLVRRRAGWFAAAGLAVTSAVVAIVLAPAGPEPGAQCARAGDRVRQVWTPARRQAVTAAFTATGLSYATAALDALLPRVDRAADALAGARIEACAATHARGEQSQARLDLRMRCLDQQLAQLGATIDVLATADATVVDLAPRALGALEDPVACASVERLALAPPEPVDPDVRSRLAGLRDRLAVTQVGLTWRRYRDVLDELRAIAADAERIGYCPVEVEARRQLATALAYLRSNKDEYVAALDRLRRAILDADACGDDRSRVKALIVLLDIWDANDVAGLRRLSAEAEAAGHRFAEPNTQLRLLAALSDTARDAGDLDRAIALGEQALAEARRAPSSANPLIEMNLAAALLDKGELDRAKAMAEAGIAGLRRDHGKDHATVAKAVLVLAMIYNARGAPDRAMPELDEALRIQHKLLDPVHKDVLKSRTYRAETLIELGQLANAAAQLEQDLPIADRVLGPDHETTLLMTTHLARAYRRLARLDEALALARTILATRLRTVGPAHAKTGSAHARLGEILDDRGDHAEAIAELRAALAIHTQVLGAASPETATTSLDLAIALVASGKPAEALPLLHAARAVYDKLEDRTRLSQIELTLARALWDAGEDRAQARALATSAQARAGASAEVRGRAAAWLAAHP